MNEIGNTFASWAAPLRRLWWLPMLAALAAGGLTWGLNSTPTYSTHGVINTRATVDLPNDRLDLISDLSIVSEFDTVLVGPARDAGISVSEVRSRINIERVAGSSLAGVTYTSSTNDPEAGEDIVSSVIDSAARFLAEPAGDAGDDSSALSGSVADEVAAASALKEAALANGGVPPNEELQVLQQRLINAKLDQSGGPRIAELRRLIDDVYDAAQDYTTLLATHAQKVDAVTTLQTQMETDAAQRLALVDNLAVTFVDKPPIPTANTPRARRALSAAIGGGVLAIAILLAFGAVRQARAGAQPG